MMKFFLAIALIATVASASIVRPTPVSAELAEIQEIIAAIQSPSTNPATAAALEQMLYDLLGVDAEPIAVGPALIESEFEPISVGPAMIDFPLPDGGVVAEESVIVPSPVVIGPGPVTDVAATSAPLVQIILNINQVTAEPTPIVPAPVAVAEPAPIPPMPVYPIGIVAPEVIQPEPGAVAEPAFIPPMPVHPIGVVAPEVVPVEPVVIGTPIIPAPAVVLPEELN